MYINYDVFTRRLKEERINSQITQIHLSKKIRMLPSHYQKAENGFNRFSLYELQNISSAGIDLFYCFTGKRSVSCYDELFQNAGMEHIIGCLQAINMLANLKRKRGNCKEEWERLYSQLKYLMYVDIGLSEERNIFKAVRDYHGITQMNMAEELGIDVKKLRALENDKIFPDSELILRTYEKYGVSPSAFIRHKKCIQSEIAYLLDSVEGKTGDDLLLFVKTILFFMH